MQEWPVLTTVMGVALTGPDIMMITVVVLLGSAIFVGFMPSIFRWLMNLFKESSGLGKVLLFFPILLFGILTLLAVIVVAIMSMFAAAQAATAFRNWWHQGASK